MTGNSTKAAFEAPKEALQTDRRRFGIFLVLTSSVVTLGLFVALSTAILGHLGLSPLSEAQVTHQVESL